jgi:hypothetical protein
MPQVELIPNTEEGPHEEHNAQGLPGDQSAWFTALLASPLSPTSLSRVLPLLLKLNYNGNPLRWSTKEGWHYVSASAPAVIERLPTSRGQKTSQILSARHGKVLLASGEMGTSDQELAALLSSSGVLRGKDDVRGREDSESSEGRVEGSKRETGGGAYRFIMVISARLGLFFCYLYQTVRKLSKEKEAPRCLLA